VARRLPLLLIAVLGALALVLAVVGIYGVTAYQVVQRHRELGVRLALGATAVRVVRHVVAGGAAVAGVGIALGLGGAFLLARAFSSLLFGVRPTDPMVFGLVGVAMAVVSIAACWIPARRAGRVDPAVALRAD
jgi:ABC-type antimicrobial peptide transport system permease subunit